MAGVAAAGLPLGAWLRSSATATLERPPPGRFGALRPDPSGILDLLEGFSYRILERSGAPMSDGHPVPARPDGMACFAGEDGTLILMRNHELPGGLRGRLAGLPSSPLAYDGSAAGGVTRLVLDARTLARRSSNRVLAGTSTNCAGGASPWGWLSCEESTAPGHGYVFLCDPAASELAAPRRLPALGRFRHEAAAVDPARGAIYLSEDQHDSAFYRFVPHELAQPFEGRLQALRVRGRPGAETRRWQTGERVEVDWVDLPDRTPERDVLRHRAHRLGAASFKRGEGLAFADGDVYLCASAGGPIEAGQIFRLRDEGDGGTLEVFACSTDRSLVDMPDNIAPAPAGGIVFVEDGPSHDHLRGVTPSGEIFTLGLNAGSAGELAGVCFAPDGRAMFLNLQEQGLTLVVEGPFDRLV
jgi:secreted PhoX family phosphatase